MKNCPKEYDEILKNIDELVFSDRPNYSFFYEKLQDICTRNNVQMNEPFDWTPRPALKLDTNNISVVTQEETSTKTGNPNDVTTEEMTVTSSDTNP